MSRRAARWSNLLDRGHDRVIERPPGLASWLDDRPPALMTLGLSLQQVAVIAGYFVLPIAVASAISPDPAEVTRYLCLSIIATALWTALQLLTRGPIGSGYPIPATHTSAMIGAYMLIGQTSAGFGALSAMVLLSGLAAIGLTFAMRRLRVLLPNEVAGVVVILLGVAVVVVGSQQLGLQPDGSRPKPEAVAVALLGITVMAVVTLSRTRASPFAVLIGALVAAAPSLALGQGAQDAGAVLAATPWFGLPAPWPPEFDKVTAAPLFAFLLSLIAVQANTTGAIVLAQRAVDGGWTKPDPPPIRRGLLANGAAIAITGLLGGAAPGPNSVVLGLSITAGTLARRIVWVAVPLLVLLAFCPKLVVLFVLTPGPVRASVLFFVGGFIMAQGCQLATARLLDTRRAMVVAFGLSAGIAAAISPLAFVAALPALASPLAFGAVVAFAVNLVTMPLVTKRSTLSLPLDGGTVRVAAEWAGELARSWGLKPETGRAFERSLLEVVELLAARGVPALELAARRDEDRLELVFSWAGAALPAPSETPRGEDLLGETEKRERFMVWMALRETQAFTTRATALGHEARLVFED